MEQVLFIVWRESVEALLVVGILYTGCAPRRKRGLAYLWGGVAAGAAVALALVLLGISSAQRRGPEWFQGIMSLAACALVVQMVIWMKKHGRTLKSELEGGARTSVANDNWWGLFLLVAIAVAREGSETVVFLYGTVSAGEGGGDMIKLALAGVGGFIAALLTFWLLQLGGKLITAPLFRVTEILLLLLAGALLVGGLDRLISLDVVPAIVDPVWDTSALLSDSTGLGKILADFAGYRAMPALISVLVWVAYWIWSGRCCAGPAPSPPRRRRRLAARPDPARRRMTDT